MRYTINMRVRGAALIIHDDAVLLVEFYDEQNGLHYVLPGGSVEVGENIRETVRRETLEETCLSVDPGPLVFAYEYNPREDSFMRELPPAVTLVFACKITGGKPRFPDSPDPGQTGVRWIPLDELDSIHLSPPIQQKILVWAYGKEHGIDLIEEWKIS